MLFSYLKEKNIACIVATHDADDALSFADQMIVIRDNTIIAQDSPLTLYNAPKDKYIAALSDDVNEIVLKDQKQLLYPHQIKIVEKSELSAEVMNSFFKGFYWLIELSLEGQTIFVNHHHQIKKGEMVSLSIPTLDI